MGGRRPHPDETARGGQPMSAMNQDLVAVSTSLNELARKIHDEKLVCTDEHAYAALNNLLVEISHRIAMVGGLIFAERSNKIAAAAREVEDSKDQLGDAIDQAEKLKNLLRTATAFLGTVDNVIGVAREVMAGV